MSPWQLESELCSAILRNDDVTLKNFLNAGIIDADHVLPDNRTLLQMAVDEHKTKVVEFLVQHKCDVNKVGNALRPYIEDAKVCLDKTNLYRAICYNNGEVVRLLVKGGADLSLQDELGCTALWHATDAGNCDIVETLLASKKCNVNQSDYHGIAPLHVASIHGSQKLVRLLLRYRAKVDTPQIDGATPLCLALNAGARDVVTVLLQNGADPTRNRNRSDLSPMSLAIDNGADVGIVQQLCVAGAQVPANVRFLSHPSNMRGTRKVMDDDTFHWLMELSKTPSSLKDICALNIRQILMKKSRGITIRWHVEQLPLPNVLKDYLHLKHLSN